MQTFSHFPKSWPWVHESVKFLLPPHGGLHFIILPQLFTKSCKLSWSKSTKLDQMNLWPEIQIHLHQWLWFLSIHSKTRSFAVVTRFCNTIPTVRSALKGIRVASYERCASLKVLDDTIWRLYTSWGTDDLPKCFPEEQNIFLLCWNLRDNPLWKYSWRRKSLAVECVRQKIRTVYWNSLLQVWKMGLLLILIW